MTEAIQEFRDWMRALTPPMTTAIEAKCGLCTNEYEVEIQEGELKILECTDCGNTTLQMVRG